MDGDETMLDFRLYYAEKAADDRARDRERLPREPIHPRPTLVRFRRLGQTRRRG
jgi:hypothetical protein